MKYADLNAGVEYAVIPSWDYSSSLKKNPDKVDRRSVAKAELMSLDKYEYKVYRADKPHDSNFVIAPKGSRAVGYLVRSYDWAGGNQTPIYWLARPQDIVVEYKTVEARWAVEEAKAQQEEAERRKQQIEAERRDRELTEIQERLMNSSLDALKLIIGDRAKTVEAEVSRKRMHTGEYLPVAKFHLDAKTMQFLIEKVLEARDMVG